MLTIFAVPKPFEGHIRTIQRNAIRSWTLLDPRPEIILLGDEEGTEDVCREFHLRWIRDVKRNVYGTPLLDDIFKKGQEAASGKVVCYVNADIILMQGFMDSVGVVCRAKKRFLMSGRRTNVDIRGELDFEAGWGETLTRLAQEEGTVCDQYAMDYFVFSNWTLEDIPPFALGRFYWDNWLVNKAISCKVSFVDATGQVRAIHQTHGHVHSGMGGDMQSLLETPEARDNVRMAGGAEKLMGVDSADYILADDRVVCNFTRLRLEFERVQNRIADGAKLRIKYCDDFMDRRLGEIGLFLKGLSPSAYIILKRMKRARYI